MIRCRSAGGRTGRIPDVRAAAEAFQRGDRQLAKPSSKECATYCDTYCAKNRELKQKKHNKNNRLMNGSIPANGTNGFLARDYWLSFFFSNRYNQRMSVSWLSARDLNLRFLPTRLSGFPKSAPCYPFLRPMDLMASLISRMCTSWETWNKIMIPAGLKEAARQPDCSRAEASVARNGCEISKTGLAPSARSGDSAPCKSARAPSGPRRPCA